MIWLVATVAPSRGCGALGPGARSLLARVIVRGGLRLSPAETGDLGEVSLTHLEIPDPQALLGCQAEDPDLALVGIAVHLVGRLSGLLEGEGLGQGGVNEAAGDEAVGFVGLAVVREVIRRCS